MIKVIAFIKLYNVRKTPIFTKGYRPGFNFIEETGTSGHITLLDRRTLYPGEEAIVEISFLYKEYLGKDFGVGKKFIFYEGKTPTGEGEVKEIIQWE